MHVQEIVLKRQRLALREQSGIWIAINNFVLLPFHTQYYDLYFMMAGGWMDYEILLSIFETGADGLFSYRDQKHLLTMHQNSKCISCVTRLQRIDRELEKNVKVYI